MLYPAGIREPVQADSIICGGNPWVPEGDVCAARLGRVTRYSWVAVLGAAVLLLAVVAWRLRTGAQTAIHDVRLLVAFGAAALLGTSLFVMERVINSRLSRAVLLADERMSSICDFAGRVVGASETAHERTQAEPSLREGEE